MPMDYFVWVALSGDRTIVIDTGFGEGVAARRGRTLLRDPVDALGLIGVDAAKVQEVVITRASTSRSWRCTISPAGT
jgi:hypothetical protein